MLWIIGLVMGHVLPGWTQTTALKWGDVVGTWEQVLDQGTLKQGPLYSQPSILLAHGIIFRPDSATIWTQVWVQAGDTLACSHKLAASYTDGSGTRRRIVNDTIVGLASDRVVLRLDGQQLVAKYLYVKGYDQDHQPQLSEEGIRVYKRVEPARQAFRQVLAAGLAPGHAIPSHPPAPTDTAVNLFGAWEGVPLPTWSDSSTLPFRTLRRAMAFLPDGTILRTQAVTDNRDTLACGGIYGERWTDWQRTPSDTTIPVLFSKSLGVTLLDGRKLSFFGTQRPGKRPGEFQFLDPTHVAGTALPAPYDVYEAVDRLKQP